MTINDGGSHAAAIPQARGTEPLADPKPKEVQEPIAIVGVACRLPGHSNSPTALWDFIERGGVAKNQPPESRFKLKTHFDKSRKPHTMRTPGGMFLEDIDPADFDAGFFNLSRIDAIAMDPQQRQLLEVVYEGLENAGITLEQLDDAPVGCFVGSYAVDYADMANRDPEDRATGITVGIGRAILSNRISHFLNIKGPSMTIDTACSGSLVSVDVACCYLHSRQMSAAIVAASNMYLSPEHNMDMGAMRGASSATGKCHTFDAKADGYCKSEAANAVILKRLDDAIRDGDPIRAVIRGTSTNSDGRTPGIASPSSEAQAIAIRAAYENAGITNLNDTSYLECHGTGTLAGDPIEVAGASMVFGPTRSADNPLIIGSIKSNIGHSEPAAGISGLLKATLAIERGVIPGNPTFDTPNPKIDFETLKVRASKHTIPWPEVPFRRASVNSFGYGGSNAHVVLEDAESVLRGSTKKHTSSYIVSEDDLFADEIETSTRPHTLVFSANDEESLKSYCKAIRNHLINPSVNVKLSDLAHTLSERRTRHFHRAYVVTQSATLDEAAFVYGKKNIEPSRIGFVFTGQGAQWSQMGKGIVDTFPTAKAMLRNLDDALQSLPTPPKWSLMNELVEARSPEHLRLPEFSQPLVTALQLVILDVLQGWGVRPQSVVGHSSGEIAAACAAGHLTPQEAIKIAYYRGQAANDCQADSKVDVGMLAVGLGADQVQGYLQDSGDLVQIACYNSPSSVTISGDLSTLEKVKSHIQEDGHFARLLQVNLAYHSKFMAKIGEHYEDLLIQNCASPLAGCKEVTMFSSVTGKRLDQATDARYWKSNMISPVRFEQASHEMLSGREGADFLIELGPSGALAGPISQIKRGLPSEGSNIQYYSASKRGPDSILSMFDVAGRLFVSDGPVALPKVNEDTQNPDVGASKTIIDLPNYVWNHKTKYWHESDASLDWRYRQFVSHDLLGTKLLGASWHAPSFKKTLSLKDVPWLKDHKMGPDIVFPAAGYIAMAVEALYQTSQSINPVEGVDHADQLSYRLRNVKFDKALVLEESGAHKIMMDLSPRLGTKESWYEFKVSSTADNVWSEHCTGLIRLEKNNDEETPKNPLVPLKYTTPGHSWYKAMHDAGYNFGPLFQKHLEVESTSGARRSRSLVSLAEPPSEWTQSAYPMHPACIDGCFQSVAPSLWQGNRSSINAVLVPAIVDTIVINSRSSRSETGISETTAEYIGVGRREDTKNYMSHGSVYDPDTGALIFKLLGLRYHKLDTRADRNAAHNYTRIAWKPDITFLSQEHLLQLTTRSDEPQSSTNVNQIIDLKAFKKPNLKVMEVNLSPHDTSNFWFQGDSFDKSSRAAYRKYCFASNDATALIDVQGEYESQPNTTFSLLDLTKNPSDFTSSETDFDFIIVKLHLLSDEALTNATQNARSLLYIGGHLLLLEQGQLSADSSDSDDVVVVKSESSIDQQHLSKTLSASGFETPLKLPCEQQLSDIIVKSAFLTVAKFRDLDAASFDHTVNVVYLSKDTKVNATLKDALQTLGWQVTEHSMPLTDLQPKSTVLIIDELHSPMLTGIDEDQWQAIKHLISLESKILWVTAGSQLNVTKPDNALIHGFFRTIRAEDPSLSLTTLDVESNSGSETITAVDRVLKSMEYPAPKTQIENEFVERRGLIHVSRIFPDALINQAKNEDTFGAEPQVQSLHDSESTVRMRCERLGNIDSLQFAEVSPTELPLREECVEVEIYSAGLNFKDVAVTMGIVPENEHLLGLEGAGVIRRVGKNVNSFKTGQRALVFEKGTFGNRIQATTERVHALPDCMTFEDAATLPAVYLTSIYSLFHLADIQKGQTVLIHSAAGGIGVASIQLCQYKGAEIFVTVGTEDKRNFLIENFGISPARIFSSRTTAFASEIMSVTDGKGVDVILNSLTGDLLDESWRIIADGGTMVEIGKKDIIDRNSLSMEPFNRNASFRAVDFSHKQISDALIGSIFTSLFDLIAEGHVKPISPIKIFPFEEIPAAFRYMRGGKHIGKIVFSSGDKSNVEVPVRRAERTLSLRSDVSYLIVGGLKGLCGSLAIYLAQHGAKHLVVMSRSGHGDERSQAIVTNVNALGCQVEEAKGDVSNFEDVRRAFRNASVPIGGVIQGAMVLRDRTFSSMTVKEYHETICNKVQGTWNLHNAALEQSLSLDFFTMLSSISGVVGQKGQANYAAANVFLDNFSVFRRSMGLPACSVDLGVIEDIGYIHEHAGLQQQLNTSIWTGINESLLHKILRFSIFQQMSPINEASASQLITGIPVPQPEESELARDARFGGLFMGSNSSSAGRDSKDGSKDIQAFFLLLKSGGDPQAVLASAVDVVNKQFTKSLRLSEPMEPAKSLTTYGLDSLAAVEFRNWVRMELGAELTTLEITNATSLFSLCEKIISKIAPVPGTS